MKIGRTVFSLFIAALICSGTVQCGSSGNPAPSSATTLASTSDNSLYIGAGLGLTLGAGTAYWLSKSSHPYAQIARCKLYCMTDGLLGNADLHRAARHGCARVVEMLIERDTQTKAQDSSRRDWERAIIAMDSNGHTPLYVALAPDHGNVVIRNSIIRLLTSYGQLESMTKSIDWTVRKAADNNRLDIIKRLVEFYVDPTHGRHIDRIQNLKDGEDWQKAQALLQGINRGDRATVLLALAVGADVNLRCIDKSTPLHVAAQQGHTSICQDLIAHGANIEARERHGNRPLHVAADNGREPIVRLLLEHGAEIDATQDSQKCTALILAAHDGHERVARTLLRYGTDSEQKTRSGETALERSIGRRHMRFSQTLVERGADLEPARQRLQHFEALQTILEQVNRERLQVINSEWCHYLREQGLPDDVVNYSLGFALHPSQLRDLAQIRHSGRHANNTANT